MKFNMHDLFNKVDIPESLQSEQSQYDEKSIRKKINKKRIKQDSKFMKRRIAIIAASILVITTTGLAISQTDFFKNIFNRTELIDITFNNNRGHSFQLESGEIVGEDNFKIEDDRVFARLGELLSESKEMTSKEKEKYLNSNMNFMNHINFKVKDEQGKEENIKGYYDNMEYFGYIEYKDKKLVPPKEFFAYTNKLNIYKDTLSLDIPEDSKKVLEKNNWHPDMLINRQKTVLPKSFDITLDTKQDEVFYIFMNEFSKSSGYDYSKYAGKEVEIESISLSDIIGEPYYYYSGAFTKAIVLKYDGKIIGVSVYSSMLPDYMRSLEDKTIKDLTKKTAEEWYKEKYNFDDKRYQEFKNLEPEEVVREYVEATFNIDFDKQKALELPSLKKNMVDGSIHISNLEVVEVPTSHNMRLDDYMNLIIEGSKQYYNNPRISNIEELPNPDDSRYDLHFGVSTEGVNYPAGSGGRFLGYFLTYDERIGWKISDFGF